MIKKLIRKIVFVYLVLFAFSVNAQDEVKTILDLRDSSVYKIVEIGEQTWMAENLNYKIERSWCYGKKAENCDTFGRLYSWNAAMKACPEGWHLPSDEEWKQMEKYLGMSDTDLDKYDRWRGTDQGTKLLNDSITGFNVLLGGFRNPPYNNVLINIQAFFWTSTEQDGISWYRQFYKKSPQIFRRTRPKSWSFSVRCIMD